MSGQHTWRSEFQTWLIESMAWAGLNQRGLEAASGITQQQISKYLSGKDVPGDDYLRALAGALGVSSPTIRFHPDTAVAEPAPAAFAEATGRDLLRQLLTSWRRLRARQRRELVRYAAGLESED